MIILKKKIRKISIKFFFICSLISILISLKTFIVQKSKLINKLNIKYNKNGNCFLSPENEDKKIIHIIITYFMVDFYKADGFPKKIYTKEYLKNGIRVMKKYLLPSLQQQSCKDFIWMLNVGDKANITNLKSLLNFDSPFKSIITYNRDHKNFIRKITKNIDILITTRIDYDDRIYWNAVNDVRRVVNRTKPIFLYGYNRGFIYFEDMDVYTHFFMNYNNNGTMSIFQSLIIFMNKVNDSYTIYDLRSHTIARKNLLEKYKQFGLEKLDYEPAYIECEIPKFVWVRQNFSGTLKSFNKPITKAVHFNLDNFYGIKK